jgi:hypothetical protein
MLPLVWLVVGPLLRAIEAIIPVRLLLVGGLLVAGAELAGIAVLDPMLNAAITTIEGAINAALTYIEGLLADSFSLW